MKNIYTVAVSESFERLVDISAKSKEEALEKVKEDYRKEKIVLEYSDFVETKFVVCSECFQEKNN